MPGAETNITTWVANSTAVRCDENGENCETAPLVSVDTGNPSLFDLVRRRGNAGR